MGGPAGQLPGALWRHYYNRKYGAGTHARKNFSENYPQFWHPPKTFASSVLGRKSLKNFGLKVATIFLSPGHPYVSDRLLIMLFSQSISRTSVLVSIVVMSNLRISKALRVLTRILCTLICSYHKWGSWWYYEDKNSKFWIWSTSTVNVMSTFASYRPGYTTVSPVLTGTAESWWSWKTGMITQQFNEIFFFTLKEVTI